MTNKYTQSHQKSNMQTNHSEKAFADIRVAEINVSQYQMR